MEKKVVVRVEPGIVRVVVTDDTLSVDLEDGRTIAVPIGGIRVSPTGHRKNGLTLKLVVQATVFTGLIWMRILGLRGCYWVNGQWKARRRWRGG